MMGEVKIYKCEWCDTIICTECDFRSGMGQSICSECYHHWTNEIPLFGNCDGHEPLLVPENSESREVK